MMRSKYRYWLLPFLGGLSAWLAFLIASPFVPSLDRMNSRSGDLSAHYSLGSVWAPIQHGSMGLLLCGSFCLVLEMGHRTPRRLLRSVCFAAFWGAIINIATDSLQDLLNARLPGVLGPTEQTRHYLYSFFKAASMVLPVLLAIGFTRPRFYRAAAATIVATVLAIFGNAIAQLVLLVAFGLKLRSNSDALRTHEIPLTIWGTEAIIVGICVGLAFLLSELCVRSGSIRLILARNEYLDWNLDHQRNRIGSGEVEIPVRGFKDVEPVHCCIFRHDNQFTLDGNHAETYLNGSLVTQASLRDGDTIQIGNATLQFFSNTASIRQRSYIPQIRQEVEVAEAPKPASTFSLIDLAGKAYILEPGSNSVGREVGNSICLAANGTVSRHHGVIEVDGGQVVVSDAGSANGTRVNKLPITIPTSVQPGDEVAFGSAIFTLQSRE